MWKNFNKFTIFYSKVGTNIVHVYGFWHTYWVNANVYKKSYTFQV
jgi:hypothetical protein